MFNPPPSCICRQKNRRTGTLKTSKDTHIITVPPVIDTLTPQTGEITGVMVTAGTQETTGIAQTIYGIGRMAKISEADTMMMTTKVTRIEIKTSS